MVATARALEARAALQEASMSTFDAARRRGARNLRWALLLGICVAALSGADAAFAQAGTERAGSRQLPTPTNLRITSPPTTASVQAAWDPSTSPSGSVDYHVEMDNFILTWWLGRNITSQTLTFGHDPGGTHTFSIWATDTFDPSLGSPRSNTITVTAPPE
jgi:hypothetical protein